MARHTSDPLGARQRRFPVVRGRCFAWVRLGTASLRGVPRNKDLGTQIWINVHVSDYDARSYTSAC